MNEKIEVKNLYQTIFNTINDCIAVYKVINSGENFEFVDINNSCAKLENVKREELIGRNVTDVFPGVKKLGLFDIFVEVYKTGQTIDHPLAFYEDSRVSGYRENIVYKLNENHIITIYSDITKKKQAEQELKKTLSFLKSYKIAMNESSIVTKSDLKGRITYANDNFYKITGFTKDETIGKMHSLVRHKDNPETIFKELWKTIKAKKAWKGILKNKGKLDDYWVDTTILPILDDKDEIIEYIAIRHDITQMIKQQEKLDNIINTDSLTGLGNRYKLNNDIKSSNSAALAVLNIDNFTQINDFYGHDVGDKIIKEVGTIINKKVIAEGCNLYHLQGDEYVVFTQNILKGEFIDKLNSLSKFLSTIIITHESEQISFNFSIGVSFEKRENILRSADMALKIAKKENKNIIFYSDEISLDSQFENNIKWTKKIKAAIEEDKFIPVFQPIVNNTNNKWEKYECLVRMEDDDKLISPYFFLDISKKTKHYTQITKIMISKSFEAFKDKDVSFSINLTIEDILDVEINKFIFTMLETYKIGSRVVFEIVESESIINFDDVYKFIEDVKSFDCKIAIDDFGTGYSNFEYLVKLNADFIKIDGSLIKDIDTNKTSQIVVKNLVNFAKDLNMKTIAEFVENEAILNKIKELDIDYAQGYYFGAPTTVLE